MNWFGLLVGIAALLIIGLGFIWVIRGERFLGYLWWPYAMGTGALCVIGSLFVTNLYASALLGTLGASLLWGATELKEQAIRAELGWYPFRSRKIAPPFADVIKKWRAPSL
ncbi:MAG TPA: DUF4491 family protein [Anaerolineales bacterium]|nr:DUF4491 family protein [Anaerolineales bacterium]